MQAIASKAFVVVSFVGIIEAFYHAWLEKAFSTNIFAVSYSTFGSFLGVPYWLFGVVWFPFVFLVGLWATRLARRNLIDELLILLTIGNAFTGYLWYLDIVVVRALDPLYIALYATNYVLTGLVIVHNWAKDTMHGYVYGTATGAVIGLLFGPYGVAACGIGGGIFGAVRNYVMPKRMPSRPQRTTSQYLQEEKSELEKRLREIESRLSEKEKA